MIPAAISKRARRSQRLNARATEREDQIPVGVSKLIAVGGIGLLLGVDHRRRIARVIFGRFNPSAEAQVIGLEGAAVGELNIVVRPV